MLQASRLSVRSTWHAFATTNCPMPQVALAAISLPEGPKQLALARQESVFRLRYLSRKIRRPGVVWMNEPNKPAVSCADLGLVCSGLQPERVEGLRLRHFFGVNRPPIISECVLRDLSDIGFEDRSCTPDGLGISHIVVPDFHVEHSGFRPKEAERCTQWRKQSAPFEHRGYQQR